VNSAARHLQGYFAGLERLTYPHELLSLGIGEGDSADDTLAELERRVQDV